MRLAWLGLVTLGGVLAGEPPRVDENLTPNGRLLAPMGRQLRLEGRPVDAVLTPDAGTLLVKDMATVRVVDAATWELKASLPLPGGASLTGMALTKDGRTLWVSNAGSDLIEYRLGDAGWAKGRTVTLAGKDGASFPCGVAVQGERAWVCLSRNNTLAEVDLTAGKMLREIEVGVAPYEIALTANGKALVSNQGGPRPGAGARTAPSAGTPVEVDERGVAAKGSVSLVDLATGVVEAEVRTGLQPSDVVLLPGGRVAAVACANNDQVDFVHLGTKTVQSVVVKPDPRLPFGSMPDGLSLSPDGRRLYVALAGANAVGVIDVTRPKYPVVQGFFPAGWYPVGVVASRSFVAVVNNKGLGSRTRKRPEAEGWNSHDHAGSLSKVPTRELRVLDDRSQKVRDLVRLTDVLRKYERGSATAKPVPVPAKLGEPSVFKHVIYVIKENRTYDQMFGDIPMGARDPRLCLFPESVTPNHHALAREFVLLDNYYCNGVLSADGHSWATEGNLTPYLNRAFGGFTRSYTFGDDPITYSSSGFVWDRVLAAGLSFRNYGEFDYAEPPTGWGFKQVWDAYAAGRPIEFTHKIGIERVRRYSNPNYPGWNMNIPDVLRMDVFLEEFKQFEADGTLPNLTVVYLPQDHASGNAPGMPTPRAHLADNDLALGRLVEAVSKSRFWPETVIFINEDDPQAGFDHIDGHRSICLVVSPYSRSRGLVSTFYNQTSVLGSILRIFGLPPLNANDAAANLMGDCFGAASDLSAYSARPVSVPLDELNKPLSGLSGIERYWAMQSATVPGELSGRRTAEHDAIMNRALWGAVKGWDVPYPAEWAGAHGRGLAGRQLVLSEEEDDD